MSNNGRQFTLQHLMGLIAIAALIFGVALGRSNNADNVAIGGVLVLAAIGALVSLVLVEALLGIRCPRCGGRSMERTAVVSFRERYFLCKLCGLKARRLLNTEWEDATDPAFEAYFKRGRPENPWTAPPGVADEELVGSKILGNLLSNKRRRNPDPPEQGPGQT